MRRRRVRLWEGASGRRARSTTENHWRGRREPGVRRSASRCRRRHPRARFRYGGSARGRSIRGRLQGRLGRYRPYPDRPQREPRASRERRSRRQRSRRRKTRRRPRSQPESVLPMSPLTRSSRAGYFYSAGGAICYKVRLMRRFYCSASRPRPASDRRTPTGALPGSPPWSSVRRDPRWTACGGPLLGFPASGGPMNSVIFYAGIVARATPVWAYAG